MNSLSMMLLTSLTYSLRTIATILLNSFNAAKLPVYDADKLSVYDTANLFSIYDAPPTMLLDSCHILFYIICLWCDKLPVHDDINHPDLFFTHNCNASDKLPFYNTAKLPVYDAVKLYVHDAAYLCDLYVKTPPTIQLDSCYIRC